MKKDNNWTVDGLFCFDLQMVSMPGIRKWPGGAFAFHSWICLGSRSTPAGSIEQVFRRQLYRLVTQKKSSWFLGRHNLLNVIMCFSLLKTLMMIIYVLSLPLLSEQFCNKFGLWIWGVHHHGLWPRGVCVQQEGALFSGDLRHKPGGWALGTSLLHVQPILNTQILRICMQKSTCTNILNSEVLHIVNSIHKKNSLSKWS